MDNTGRMSGTINKQWFLYQEKEVFQDKRQKKLILGIPNELEKGENRIRFTWRNYDLMAGIACTVCGTFLWGLYIWSGNRKTEKKKF